MSSRSGTFVARKRPPGANPMPIRLSPDLLVLTEATSNVAFSSGGSGACATGRGAATSNVALSAGGFGACARSHQRGETQDRGRYEEFSHGYRTLRPVVWLGSRAPNLRLVSQLGRPPEHRPIPSPKPASTRTVSARVSGSPGPRSTFYVLRSPRFTFSPRPASPHARRRGHPRAPWTTPASAPVAPAAP
jgi:hypothetical protein